MMLMMIKITKNLVLWKLGKGCDVAQFKISPVLGKSSGIIIFEITILSPKSGELNL